MSGLGSPQSRLPPRASPLHPCLAGIDPLTGEEKVGIEGATLMGEFTSQGLSSRVGAFEIHVHHLPNYFLTPSLSKLLGR